MANLEKYISESYNGRSLIELLQNADDAGATKFLIKKAKNSYIIANNGREFNDNDVLSICRSGASTKQRSGNSIGFRGIGFKSIVNYAESVHLISGDIQLSFSKELTKKILGNNSNVPLIRIPHKFKDQNKYAHIITDLIKEDYNTIFIFNVKSDALSTEIKEFISTTMLFLQNIKKITFYIDSNIINYKIKRSKYSHYLTKAIINSDDKNSNWLISDDSTNRSSIAFQINSDLKAVKIDKNEAVIHSFTPTKDPTGIPIIFHGDFSTDPSRTRIVLDEETSLATKNCVKILINNIIHIISSENDENGIIEILKDFQEDLLSSFKSKKIGDLIISEFKELFLNSLKSEYDRYEEFFIQPPWINLADFKKICEENNIVGFGENIERKIPNILLFLKKVGIEEVPLDMAIVNSAKINYSIQSRAKIFVEIVKKYRFGFNENEKNLISNANLLEFESGCKSIKDRSDSDKLSPEFYTKLIDLIDDEKDLVWLLKKFNLYDESSGTFEIKDKSVMKNNNLDSHSLKIDFPNAIFESKSSVEKVSFKEKPIFKKWRRVEENVAFTFENMKNVVKVTDVSKSNLGYDLEVQLKDKIHFIEVKSVNKLGDSFSMTNNEYATASEYKDKYALVITEQSTKSLKMCIIYNPINQLDLFKRVTRWEWVCNEYDGNVLSTNVDN